MISGESTRMSSMNLFLEIRFKASDDMTVSDSSSTDRPCWSFWRENGNYDPVLARFPDPIVYWQPGVKMTVYPNPRKICQVHDCFQ